jgi:hypothetical protein
LHLPQQRTYTPQEIADVASYLDKQVARPERVPASDVTARAGLLGIGAILVTGGAAWLFQMPWEYALQICGLSFMFTTGAAIWWIMPTDKRENAARFRRMIQTCEVERTKKLAAYAAIQRLETTVANQANETPLKKAQRPCREPETATTGDCLSRGENIERAQTILHYCFESLRTRQDGRTVGEWYSRAIAARAGWTQDEHAAAVLFLEDAGLVGTNGKLKFVFPQFDTYAAAVDHFNNFCNRARREPELPQQQRIMSNDD